MGTEYEHAIIQGELAKNEYYVSSMDGAKWCHMGLDIRDNSGLFPRGWMVA